MSTKITKFKIPTSNIQHTSLFIKLLTGTKQTKTSVLHIPYVLCIVLKAYSTQILPYILFFFERRRDSLIILKDNLLYLLSKTIHSVSKSSTNSPTQENPCRFGSLYFLDRTFYVWLIYVLEVLFQRMMLRFFCYQLKKV